MTSSTTPEMAHTTPSRKPAFWLVALFALQGVAAAFFLGDVVADLLGIQTSEEGPFHDLLETAVTAALIFGLVFTGLELRRVLRRQNALEDQLMVASGAFQEVLQKHFAEWQLTPSERDVALLAIKGLSIAEIAAVRETREGTIKSQCNAIYSKAGVTGRTQLLSLFIEELMGERLV